MKQSVADVIIVGSGIIGLAFAYMLQKKGQRVMVLEQHQYPVSSSVRNFGLITVTGQPYKEEWELAKRGSELWRDVLQEIGLRSSQEGCLFTARSFEGEQLLNEYLESEAGCTCRALSTSEMAQQFPFISDSFRFAFTSPHELRVDSAQVIRRLIDYLKELGVVFAFNCRVYEVSGNIVNCSIGKLNTSRVIVAGGIDTRFMFPNLWSEHKIEICKLQMQLVKPKMPISVSHSVMSDFSYHFYAGFKQMPSSNALSAWFEENYPEFFKHNMHMIVVQNDDGNMIIGDSHEYLTEIDPFEKDEIYELQHRELKNIFKRNDWEPLRKWVGYYPWSANSQTLVTEIESGVTVVLVNRGKGMTISFALAEKTVSSFT